VAIDERLLADICAEARSLNPGDALQTEVLRAIAAHAGRRPIRFSVETGCGGSTLLLSNLSEEHVVFAIEGDNRVISRVGRSRYFRGQSTRFVEGPTQLELPRYHFARPIDLALLDGPHAFPFPQLEYYAVYPHLSPGALLIIDDIHIPSIHDLFRFLRADAMFRLVRRIGTTAFFERTQAPVFPPHGDGWWEQGYNRTRLWRFTWREALRSRVPASWRRAIKGARAARISIDTPAAGAVVGAQETVSGHAALAPASMLWLFVHRIDIEGWWPQGSVSIARSPQPWEVVCRFGEEIDAGHEFEIAAAAVEEATHRRLQGWVDECRHTREYPPIQLPDHCRPVLRKVRRAGHRLL
jgi:hypothetical protein